MQRTFTIFVSIVMTFVITSTLLGQGIEKGSNSIGGRISLSETSTDSDRDTIRNTISGKYGYFINDSIELSGRLFYSLSETESVSTRTDSFGNTFTTTTTITTSSFSLQFEPNYHFNPQSNAVFFGGIHTGLTYYKSEFESTTTSDFGTTSNSSSDSDTSLSFGLQAGVKHFVTKQTSIDYELRYTSTNSGNDVGGDRDETLFSVGVSYWF